MAHRCAQEVDGDLDDIVIGIAERGGSFEAAEPMVYGLTQRFYLLGEYLYLGRARDHDLARAGAAMLWANTSSSTVSRTATR
jgi:hypothetical protein